MNDSAPTNHRPLPNAWLLLGSILGPAAIIALAASSRSFTQSTGALLLVLPILAGLICGISLFVSESRRLRQRPLGQPLARAAAFSVAFGLICALASGAFLFGACICFNYR